MRTLLAIISPTLFAFAQVALPTAPEVAEQVSIRGYIVAPDRLEMFGNGPKEFAISSAPDGWHNGSGFNSPLCFDRDSIYREIERHSGTVVEIRGRWCERGYREWLLVEGVELVK